MEEKKQAVEVAKRPNPNNRRNRGKNSTNNNNENKSNNFDSHPDGCTPASLSQTRQPMHFRGRQQGHPMQSNINYQKARQEQKPRKRYHDKQVPSSTNGISNSNQARSEGDAAAGNHPNNKSQTARPSRKARSKMGNYEPYASLQELLPRYVAGEIIRGKIRMLPGKDKAAFCSCDKGSFDRDIIIATPRDQNRAIHGDLVYVELLPEDEEYQGESEQEESATEEDAEVEELADQMEKLVHSEIEDPRESWQDDQIQVSLWDPLVKIRRVHTITDTLKTESDLLQRKGRVVHVVHPKETAGNQPSELNPFEKEHVAPRRTIVGTMTSVRQKDGKSMYLLTPNNKCMPQFLCPASFRPEADAGGLYKAEYVYGSWGEKHNWPPCINVKEMGKTCNVQDETLALLIENGVDHGDFTGDVLKNVQDAVQSGLEVTDDDMGWRPTEEMYNGRRDYRNQRIFTIDPTTAKDLDDALHITALPDGGVELGVHIADVSYFVTPKSPVDQEATRRATTVYLVDRVIPMLPRPLCEVACSLNENVERLAFSCVWRMNMDGTLGSKSDKKATKPDQVWYGRSVIKSCARLDYATAQNIIDKKVGNGEAEEDMDEAYWPKSRRPTGGHTVDEVAADVRLMHKVAMARRKLRFLNGAIALNGVKLTFKLGSDGETPDLCAPYPIRDSNRLVEEYMLLANYLVAQRLITHAGALALLRHHPPPLTNALDSVVAIAKAGMGFSINTTSSQTLQASLSRMGRECDDELVMQCITELLMTPMCPAEYMAAGSFREEEWRHFALNIPYYTHFTSPIRRYADVIVHRLLQATIDETVEEFEMKKSEIQSICDHCNAKKMASKTAQDRSDRVFLAIYLKNKPLRGRLGVVISVGERTFTVFVQELGCSAKLFLDEHKQMVDAENYTAKNGQRQIKLNNKRSGGTWSMIDIKIFAKIKVSVLCKEKPPIDIKVQLEGPWQD